LATLAFVVGSDILLFDGKYSDAAHQLAVIAIQHLKARDGLFMHIRPNDTPVITCAQCGERLIVSEWSEHVDEYRVRHIWKCEPCHYSFEATIASRRRSMTNLSAKC
jgi:hypothetical protein